MLLDTTYRVRIKYRFIVKLRQIFSIQRYSLIHNGKNVPQEIILAQREKHNEHRSF
jgi:hypothetical protein